MCPVLFLCELIRCVAGRELLRIQAVEPDDEEHLDKFTEQQLTDLAGNAFPVSLSYFLELC